LCFLQTTSQQIAASELIKLWAFALPEYHRVVHLDVDAMLLQPLDELFEQTAELVYTTDVMMADKKNKHNMPVQVAPSQHTHFTTAITI
jgi:alpha-N-acetylglucosamine transferase